MYIMESPYLGQLGESAHDSAVNVILKVQSATYRGCELFLLQSDQRYLSARRMDIWFQFLMTENSLI